jgi:hypothetical protein
MWRIRERPKDKAVVPPVLLVAIRILLVVVLTLFAAGSLFLVYPRADQMALRVVAVVVVILCITIAVLLVPPELHKKSAVFVRTLLAVAGLVGLALQLLGDGGNKASLAPDSITPVATTSLIVSPDPVISVEPPSAPIRSSFTVKGFHFAPNKIVRIDMGEYIIVEQVKAGGNGSFSENVYLFPGKYWVVGTTYTVTAVQEEEALSASTTFHVAK